MKIGVFQPKFSMVDEIFRQFSDSPIFFFGGGQLPLVGKPPCHEALDILADIAMKLV